MSEILEEEGVSETVFQKLNASENDQEAFSAVITVKVCLLLLSIWMRQPKMGENCPSGFSTDFDV